MHIVGNIGLAALSLEASLHHLGLISLFEFLKLGLHHKQILPESLREDRAFYPG